MPDFEEITSLYYFKPYNLKMSRVNLQRKNEGKMEKWRNACLR